jgi:alpha-L-rhamnosidase
LSLLTLSGDDRLTRNALIQIDQSRIPEGLTLACYPNPFYLIIPFYSLVWIDQVYDYMMWKDDKDFISGFETGICNVLDWFERRRQQNGLLGGIDWWAALGGRYYNNGEPPSVHEGNSTPYSLYYAYTLRHAAEIYEYLGKTKQAAEFRDRADQICKAVNQYCKNKEGFYNDSPDNKQVSRITNLLAILSEAVTGDEARQLMKELLEPKDWFGQVDLFLHFYLFEALNKTGLQSHFGDELTEWSLMKDRGMTTFAEVPLEWGEENQRSECHPWSTSPDYFFFRTVCGIIPVAPGHRVVEIAPEFGKLTMINAVYPHWLGNIEMNIVLIGQGVKGEITIPEGMKAVFKWKNRQITLKTGKQKIQFL